MRKLFQIMGILFVLTLAVSVFTFNSTRIAAENDSVNRPQGWTEATHGNSTDGNYPLLFSSRSGICTGNRQI
jgi:hypothetical protein